MEKIGFHRGSSSGVKEGGTTCLRSVKVLQTLFWMKHVVLNSRTLDYAASRSTNVHMFSGVQTELLQFNLVSFKNWEKMNTLHIYGSKNIFK